MGMPICEAMYAMSCFSASDAELPIVRMKLTPRAAPAVAAMPRKMSRRSRLILGGEERGGGGGGGGGGGRLGCRVGTGRRLCRSSSGSIMALQRCHLDLFSGEGATW